MVTDEKTSLFVDDPEGKRALISVYLGCHGSYHKYVEEEAVQCPIAAISVSGKTKWDMLDTMVRRAFKVMGTPVNCHSDRVACSFTGYNIYC